MKYVAFLRGVNVGGRTIKMADLKACFEKLGFKNVLTVINSGNVIFESHEKVPALKQKIEAGLTKTFKYPAKAQVYELSKLQKIIDDYPFGVASADQHDYVIFIENGLEKAVMADDYNLAKGEKVQAGRGVIYWRVDKGSTLRSSFSKILSKAKYKDFNTNRNLKTVRKITEQG